MVQIRDEETHMPLSGIKVGEIGAKLGFNTVNNGFLGFDNHRITRDRMLMRNAQVSKVIELEILYICNHSNTISICFKLIFLIFCNN